MEEENKLPLKRVELSLTKFNDVAIPHHLDLLRQHKANILKYSRGGQTARVLAEQTRARRVAGQLRALLGELEALRRRVRGADLARFDRRTQRARDLTLRAVVDCLGLIERSCIALVTRAQAKPRPGGETLLSLVELLTGCPPVVSVQNARLDRDVVGETHSAGCGALSTACAAPPDSSPTATPRGSAPGSEPGSVGPVAAPDAELVQLQVDEQELELRAREATLRGWAELQAELRALHAAWQHVQAAALATREQVSAAADGVQAAGDNVQVARTTLAAAERLRAGAYGVCGALGGALLGGPAGLLLGAKAGLAVGLAAGGLGYLGGAGLARARRAPALALPAAPDKDR